MKSHTLYKNKTILQCVFKYDFTKIQFAFSEKEPLNIVFLKDVFLIQFTCNLHENDSSHTSEIYGVLQNVFIYAAWNSFSMKWDTQYKNIVSLQYVFPCWLQFDFSDVDLHTSWECSFSPVCFCICWLNLDLLENEYLDNALKFYTKLTKLDASVGWLYATLCHWIEKHITSALHQFCRCKKLFIIHMVIWYYGKPHRRGRGSFILISSISEPGDGSF